jgi:hypothetical protein
MGEFINVPRYPPAEFRGVSAPNADTLHSLAWLDRAEPQVFSHPDMGKRFYLFEMTDLWMRPGRHQARLPMYLGPSWVHSFTNTMQKAVQHAEQTLTKQ